MENSAGSGLRRVGLALAVASALLAAGCGSSLFATTASSGPPSSASSTTTSTTPPVNGVAVGVPVTPCKALGTPPPPTTGSSPSTSSPIQSPPTTGSSGRGSTTVDGWLPSFIVAPIPTGLVSQVEFYSDGAHTVLAPSNWTCDTLTLSTGATEAVVYPNGDPNPPISGAPAPGSQGVFALFSNTGQPQGIAVVCPFFMIPSWQAQQAFCVPGHLPSGENASMTTPDVAAVTDPTGVIGSLPGSGGPHAVTGVVLFPQVGPAVQNGQSLAVAEESCSLLQPALCPAILSDFDVREFPVPSTIRPGT